MPEFTSIDTTEERRKTKTGASRHSRKGKGRYDLLPFLSLDELAKHFEMGAEAHGDRNWENGMDLSWFFDSAQRHLSQYMRCRLTCEAPAENHLIAAAWNVLCMRQTEMMIEKGLLPKKLDDLPGGRRGKGV